jgi:hypothetical protein
VEQCYFGVWQGGECGAVCVRQSHQSTSDDMKEHCEGVNVTCAAKRCEYILGKIIDAVCVAVVCVEENRNMFPGCLYSVGMGASPSIHKADSVIYSMAHVPLVSKTRTINHADTERQGGSTTQQYIQITGTKQHTRKYMDHAANNLRITSQHVV